MKGIKFILVFFISCKSFASAPDSLVVVKDVNSFFKAIGSNTTILMEAGTYHLNEIDSTLFNSTCNWALVLFDEIYYDETDDSEKTLLVSGISNLKIKAARGARGKVRIVTNRKAASVMAFKQCDGLKLEGLVFGHDIDKTEMMQWQSFCSGEVLEFFDCNKITMQYDTLFGCGTRGFLAHRCVDVATIKTVIKECNYGAFGLYECQNIYFESCKIFDNTYVKLMEIIQTKNLTAKKCKIKDNAGGAYRQFIVELSGGESINLTGFKILSGNDFTSEEFYNVSKTNAE